MRLRHNPLVRGLLAAAALALLTACAAPSAVAQPQPLRTLRIGYQKGGTLPILKAQQRLEKRFADQQIAVTWLEFPAGPPLLEALNAGSIDIGATGESPAIFAQAAGTPLVYVAAQQSDVAGQALLVAKDSPITSVADLKGKKVVLGKGTSAHYFLIQALKDAGLSYGDVEPVFLNPPDARPAFESGSVDAWAIWDPYLTLALKSGQARVLRDGAGLPQRHTYYLAARSFAQSHGDVLGGVLDEVQQVEQWSKANPDQAAAALAPVVKIDESILREIAHRTPYGLEPISEQIVADQQDVADTYEQLGLIPKKIVVADAVWQWRTQEGAK
ncbi:sulfonate ABC transporter substrate-binding protein [Chloroflexia bacterium SDU3-3]|nr:sulfonate ABC transporter substrate-binding protein [Chloroflexia bacterium SDU3-3]